MQQSILKIINKCDKFHNKSIAEINSASEIAEFFKEEILSAHMTGQIDAGCKEPSYSQAHRCYSEVVIKLKEKYDGV